ncbi:MAG: hypothetical protein ACI85E_000403 [Marinomonas primoryensis]|jgi:hypothetical protein
MENALNQQIKKVIDNKKAALRLLFLTFKLNITAYLLLRNC